MLSAEHCMSRAGPWPRNLPGIWRRPLRPSLYKQPPAKPLHLSSGRAHLEKGFRVSVRTYLAVPGSTYPKVLLKANFCYPDVAESQEGGVGERQDALFTTQLEKQLSHFSSMFLNSRQHVQKACCPHPSAGACSLHED